MTPVTRTATALASAVLAVGLLPGAAPAEGPADQVSGLVGGPLGASEPQPSTNRADYGHTSAPNGTLRKGCHNYRYRYVLTLPSDDWVLETFLRDRTGEFVASGAFMADSDAASQRSHFRFCRQGTRPGRFSIHALVHWYGDSGEEHRVWLPASHFRLRRAR